MAKWICVLPVFLFGFYSYSEEVIKANAELGIIKCTDNTTVGGCNLSWIAGPMYKDFAGLQRLSRLDSKGFELGHIYPRGRKNIGLSDYAWETVFKGRSTTLATRMNRRMRTGLYRIIGCDDSDLSLGCVSSYVAWIPSKPPLESIANEFPLSNGDGSWSYAVMERDKSKVEAYATYNVYLVSNIVLQSKTSKIFPPMIPPHQSRDEPPSHEEDHLIHHNVYTNYEQLRSYRAGNSQ